MTAAVEPDTVRLEGVPATMFIASQDHQRDLVRELTLMDLDVRHPKPDRELPRTVVEFINGIHEEYDDVRSQTRDQALAALAAGAQDFTLHVPVRPDLAEALTRWLRLVEQADRLCDEGALLTLGATPEIRALRRWYAETIVWCLQAPPGETRVGRYPTPVPAASSPPASG